MAEFQLDLGIWGWFWSILQLPWPTYYIVFNSYTICCYSCILESLNKVQVVCIKNEFRLRTSNQQNSFLDAKAWFWDSVRSSTMHINNIYIGSWVCLISHDKIHITRFWWQYSPPCMVQQHPMSCPGELGAHSWLGMRIYLSSVQMPPNKKKRKLVDQGLWTIEVYVTNETRVCEPWSLRMIVRTLF